MNFSVNGQSQVPPGFRFHPTEEELLHFYLRKKISQETINLDVIRYIDLNKLEPWDIQEMCKVGSGPQNEWYFFSHKDKKYPTGTRTNRATDAGFWKATGRDKVLYNNVGRIGLRKTLVFYIGRAPCGQKSEWIMYEYRLDENANDSNDSKLSEPKVADEGWVVCRLFKKRNHFKEQGNPAIGAPQSSSKDEGNNEDDGDLNQIVRSIVKPCKQEMGTTSDSSDNNNSDMNFEGSINSTIGGGVFEKLFATHNDIEAPYNDLSIDEMLKGFEEEFGNELMGYTKHKVLSNEGLGFQIPSLSSDEEYSQVHRTTEIDAWDFSSSSSSVFE